MKNNRKFIIKICGIRDEVSAQMVFRYKPSTVGMIFVPNTPRLVSKETAQKIANLAHSKGILVVGVFQNQSLNQITDLIRSASLDYVQLHGDEDISFCRKIKTPIIKKIKLDSSIEDIKIFINKYSNVVDIFLIDRSVQGSGSIVNLDMVGELVKEYPIMIAGGLNKDNVENIIKKIGKKLLGIDVSSGVENILGEKEERLVSSFIEEGRNAYEAL